MKKVIMDEEDNIFCERELYQKLITCYDDYIFLLQSKLLDSLIVTPELTKYSQDTQDKIDLMKKELRIN